jgi:metal-responsive CopG/Arc/MetJ family transcriptional regulator
MDSDNDEEVKELRVNLSLDFFEKLKKVSEYYGIQSRTEIIRFLINKEIRNIEREKNQRDKPIESNSFS